MKLLSRFSRVADSPQYSQLCSDGRPRRSYTFRLPNLLRSTSVVPLSVGEEMVRYVVKTELLNHPIFTQLLNKSAEVYGYQQEGLLRIPCNVNDFERLLQASRRAREITPEIQNILNNI